uniref:SH3 domain-containing protein n=1 Tax=Fundulus heteroclitus TaxID=8078 RepID=A0A3Q2T238_FUNHE
VKSALYDLFMRELDLEQGELIQVLFKEDGFWWFGRLANGSEGYFPSACVELLQVRTHLQVITWLWVRTM